MKKLVTAFAACALAGLVNAQVESVNIVGYTKLEGIAGKVIVASSFTDVGGATDVIGIQSLISGNFEEDDAIAFYDNGAWATYTYSVMCSTDGGVNYDTPGWHNGDYMLSADDVALGSAFFITPVSGTRTVTLAGQVKKTTPVIGVDGAGAKTLVGIGRPLTVAINDLTITGFEEDDAIAFYDNGSWLTYTYSLMCSTDGGVSYDTPGWHNGDYMLTADLVNAASGFFVTKYSVGVGSLEYTLEL
jgi:hypothetical protein